MYLCEICGRISKEQEKCCHNKLMTEIEIEDAEIEAVLYWKNN